MKEEKTKVSVEQIYRSRLTEKCVTYDDGWMHWEAPREPEPTGYPEMDALGKLLATTPVPSVQAVTVAMGMPASILRAFVQGYTGMTVTKLIIRYRLLVGEELLRCTDLDLTSIARCAGYQREVFSRKFSAHYGQSPRDYRYFKQPNRFRELYRWDNQKLKKMER